MTRYPKKIRQKLRELSSLAYGRELNQKLDELYIKFQQWKNGKIDSLQLHDLIHDYHNREGKEVWKIYNQTDVDFIVDRAYRLGILIDDEIPADVTDALDLKE
jgi:hypothetical protein